MKRYENFSPEIEYEAEEKYPSAQDNIESDKGRSEEVRKSELSGQNPRRRRTSPGHSRTKKKVSERKIGKAAKKTGEKTAPSVKETVMEWANQKTLKLITGIFLGIFGGYLGVCFVSYLTSCIADQSAVMTDPVGFAGNISNAGGEGGARLSEFLINDTFGVGALVIVIWLVAMCLKLLIGRPKFKSVNFTIKCMVALLTLSIIIGLLTLGLDSPVNWGGFHGRFINEFIISFFGWTGAVLLCLFLIAVFIVICLRDLTNWIMRLKRARDKRRAELAELRRIEEEKRRAMLEDERREHQEAVAAGDAPVMQDSTYDDYGTDRIVEFEKQPDSQPAFEDEDYGSYVLTDEEEIMRQKQELHDNPVYSESEASGTPESTSVSESKEAQTSQSEQLSAETSPDENRYESGSLVDEHDNGAESAEEIMEIRTNTISQSNSSQAVVKSYRGYPYEFPPTTILRPGPEKINVDRSEQLEKQELIRQTLLDFKIPIESIDATVGPTVTLYEIVPATGVKVSTISSLVDDIALRLSAVGVRIIAPIPGRGTIGIEVANKDPQVVSMRSIINSEKFRNTKFRLPIALGATIENDVYIADLTKMPHLLVAGATGQGKSVGLNAIIASLLYSKTPDEVKFVMIDPKMVEFSLYAKIENHYLAKLPDEAEPIITDMDKVVATLSSLCVEMDDRYRLLKGHARNVEEYNEKFKKGLLNTLDGHRFLPYIVVIVDEFSDLIMTAGKEVEMPIARLAQKARAVGMHVIIATQRPSTKVITGNIKANFPARISFKVTSGVDSKTILDQSGAQQLIGRGDMLISNLSELVRVQCAFIDTPEVEDIVAHIESQPHPPGAYILPEPIVQSVSGGDDKSSVGVTERDPLLEEAGRSVVMANQASTSSLQRRYNIGYNRAGRIMDQLEALGIVGPSQGGKPRSVLVDANTYEDIIRSL